MTTQTLSFPDMSEMHTHAKAAAELLKQMSNEHRLMILCALGNQELAVSELNHLVPLSQSALSQHLASLRHAELVVTRKVSQTVYYRLNGDAALRIIAVLQSLYCPEYQTSSCGENS
ncbi:MULTISPECIES: metalloregulator ArsR/SmtB family transcription factor [unclassified Methylophaga]|jgi:DNA-binding transcriptional ArsR family regulator|uniref:ArsR/SmtB family transcription factor n=1 Tax=unclassified Methylophaga TaxID=2629249 RepID=UPI000C8A565A|nr:MULTISPECIES: metalloregulator ArsR/SmtB family transcription factor [unclassified Methylophaga]MAK67125.1 transcriptional regulator [Methylophaga sp.]MAY18163.1 transcriptional regulator [Methylophaga sp.]HCD06377.1 transcriptional regulator [Methylophaga sp.]|tara:strand:- start:68410 stop:68760 length:351 start_codon:yes stop_codon:yes gene_type:complete